MKRLLTLLGISHLLFLSSYSQWTIPRKIDSSVTVSMKFPVVAIGPSGEIAVVCWVGSGGGEIVSRYSIDNGRTFRSTIVAEGVLPHPSTGDGISVHPRSIGFDSSGSLYVFFETRYYNILPGVLHTVFQVSKSTNQGMTFSSYWSSGSQRYDGMNGPNLNNSSMLIDVNRSVHILWDSSGVTPPPSRITHLLIYSKIGQGNPPSRVDGVIHSEPLQPLFQRLDVDLLPVGNNVIVAVGRQVQSSSVYGLYFSRSTDGGQTFSPLVSIDTVNATVPHLTKMSDGQSLLLYNKGTPDSYSDTTLMARYIVDSIVSTPFRVGSKSIMSRSTKTLLSSGTHHYLTYQTTYASFGTTYYDFGNLQSPALDSAFFGGFDAGDLALDSLGGKYLVMAGPDGKVYLSKKDVLLDVEDEKPTVPVRFALHQNYPNPFNPTTTIRFELPATTFTSLKVYNLLGQEVSILIGELMQAGPHRVKWNAENLSGGVYFCRLDAGGFVQTRKLLLLR